MIRLTRSVPVSAFDVVSTVAVGRKRPELLAVAKLAADLRRPIRAADVLRELTEFTQRIMDKIVALG